MLEDINSDKAKLVTLYINTKDKATIDEMKSSLDLMYIELYSVLRHLVDKGIIDKKNDKTYLINKNIEI